MIVRAEEMANTGTSDVSKACLGSAPSACPGVRRRSGTHWGGGQQERFALAGVNVLLLTLLTLLRRARLLARSDHKKQNGFGQF